LNSSIDYEKIKPKGYSVSINDVIKTKLFKFLISIFSRFLQQEDRSLRVDHFLIQNNIRRLIILKNISPF